MGATASGSVIELSRNEQAAVYAALVPTYRPDKRRYSTEYRSGNSADALAIDLGRGWFDHALGRGGDVIAFVQECTSSNFRDACSTISDILGRHILAESARTHRPRYTEADLVNAELFVVGFRWHLERLLERLKESLKPDPRILEATRLLERLNARSVYDAADCAATLKGRAPKLLAECVSEARELHLQLAAAIAGAKPEGIAV